MDKRRAKRQLRFAVGEKRVWGKVAASFALALTLSACSLFRGPPPETFDLSSPASVPRAGSTAAQILIPPSTAIKVLDSQSIVVATGPKISYYPGAQWPDTLPKLFQARAIQAFEGSRKARAVGRPGEGLSIDYQLQTDIRAFEYRTETGDAHVEVAARVLDDRTGRVVAFKQFTATVPVAADKASAVVAAMQGALDKVLVDLVRWTVGQV